MYKIEIQGSNLKHKNIISIVKHGIEDIMNGEQIVLAKIPFMASDFCAFGEINNFVHKARKDLL